MALGTNSQRERVIAVDREDMSAVEIAEPSPHPWKPPNIFDCLDVIYMPLFDLGMSTAKLRRFEMLDITKDIDRGLYYMRLRFHGDGVCYSSHRFDYETIEQMRSTLVAWFGVAIEHKGGPLRGE